MKKLGANWNPKKKKWYFTNKNDETKLAKWMSDASNILPDLLHRFYENCEIGKQKYFLKINCKRKSIVQEDLDDGHCICIDYFIEKEWCCDSCNDCFAFFDKHYNMTDEEIMKECRLLNYDNPECEMDIISMCTGDISSFIESFEYNGEKGSHLIYLGQFSSLHKCRKYLSNFQL